MWSEYLLGILRTRQCMIDIARFYEFYFETLPCLSFACDSYASRKIIEVYRNTFLSREKMFYFRK